MSDLAWIWRAAVEHPNLYFDTAWYSSADLRALFTLVAPGQVLYATDIPYGSPVQTMVIVFRNALQSGLSGEQVASVAGAQLERLVAGDDAIDAGPALGSAALRPDPLLDRIGYYLVCAFARLLSCDEPTEFADLARLACQVGDDAPGADLPFDRGAARSQG